MVTVIAVDCEIARMKPNLNRLAHFVATVEAGTITGAARALGISKAVVSKQLQLLEQDVGVALLVRNTRHLTPTSAGQAFYEEARTALAHAETAFDRVADQGSQPRGTLKITTPVDYGVAHVAPMVARFRRLYPDVTIDLCMTDQQLNIVEEGIDLAFRIGWLADSSNLSRKLRDFEEIAVCSAATLERAQPSHPNALSEIPFAKTYARQSNDATFTRGDQCCTIALDVATEMNITLAIRAFVMETFAFTILPDFMLEEELTSGRLVQLLPDWSLRSGGVYTVTPPGRVRSSALEQFLKLAQSNRATDSSA